MTASSIFLGLLAFASPAPQKTCPPDAPLAEIKAPAGWVRRGLNATVKVYVLVDEHQRARQASVSESSGHPAFDQAMLEQVCGLRLNVKAGWYVLPLEVKINYPPRPEVDWKALPFALRLPPGFNWLEGGYVRATRGDVTAQHVETGSKLFLAYHAIDAKAGKATQTERGRKSYAKRHFSSQIKELRQLFGIRIDGRMEPAELGAFNGFVQRYEIDTGTYVTRYLLFVPVPDSNPLALDVAWHTAAKHAESPLAATTAGAFAAFANQLAVKELAADSSPAAPR
jgi:hypothetical protein